MAVTVQSKPKEPNFNHKTVKMSSPNVNFDQCVCAHVLCCFLANFRFIALEWAKLFDNAQVIVLLYYGHETEWKLFSQPFTE